MTGFPFLAMSFILNFIAILFIICCVVLVLIILVQKGKGGGLSSAFGGGMAGGILGSKTGDFLTWVTIVCVAIMLTLAVILAKFYKPSPTEVPGAGGTPQNQQPAAPTEKPAVTPQVPAAETNVPAVRTNTVSGSPAARPAAAPAEKPVAPVVNTGTGAPAAKPAVEANAPGN